ncbi:hypothetical protein [Parasitella parasitica]|uniref:Uncharacterized protein n=1 Tax=Parasitella parasitica TaxID=35722 RepID=A0A0B7NQH3_9FUNG|nr:hypothetical protein [Parasitella parasitica]
MTEPSSSKKSNNTVANENEIIKGLKTRTFYSRSSGARPHKADFIDVIDTVYKIEFWAETEWQQWSVQNFDCKAAKQNPGITRSEAHDDLSTLIKAFDKNSKKAQRLEQIKLALKTILVNDVNAHFWRIRAVKSVKQFIAQMSRAVAEENLTTATDSQEKYA